MGTMKSHIDLQPVSPYTDPQEERDSPSLSGGQLGGYEKGGQHRTSLEEPKT